jgi:hypothetical protein
MELTDKEKKLLIESLESSIHILTGRIDMRLYKGIALEEARALIKESATLKAKIESE